MFLNLYDILSLSLPPAGKRVTEDEVEEMLESDNPAVFTKDVRNQENSEYTKVTWTPYTAW